VPCGAQAFDFLFDVFACDATAGGERRHARDRGVEVAKVSRPTRLR
jgi:hypothetical protein